MVSPKHLAPPNLPLICTPDVTWPVLENDSMLYCKVALIVMEMYLVLLQEGPNAPALQQLTPIFSPMKSTVGFPQLAFLFPFTTNGSINSTIPQQTRGKMCVVPSARSYEELIVHRILAILLPQYYA